MKNLNICLVAIIIVFNTTTSFSQVKKGSEIRKALSKSATLHTSDIYHLTEFKGEDKAELNLFAQVYSEYNIPNKIIGIQFELHIETISSVETTSKISKDFYAFIDESEYPEVTVAVNNLIEDLNQRKEKDKFGSASYITSDGISFGYILTNKKEFAFIELNNNGTIIRAYFSNPLKFFQEFNEQLDFATKKLYLPENAEKLKNVKKSKQENIKEVIIDDI